MSIIRSKENGFTLIELLIVISIIALVGSVVLAAMSTSRSKARDTKRVQEMKSVEKALTLYSLSNNGNVPLSSYTTMSALPKKPSGSVDCIDTSLIASNNALYDSLVAAKALAARPSQDSQASSGYCYAYVSSGDVVSGSVNKVKSASFVSFLENTKTTGGYQALAGVSYGTQPPVAVNVDFTTGMKNDIDYGYVYWDSGCVYGLSPEGYCY